MDTAGEKLRCVKCGYDLRGRSRGDVCPECAEPVEHSMEQPVPDRMHGLIRGYAAAVAANGGGLLLALVVHPRGPIRLAGDALALAAVALALVGCAWIAASDEAKRSRLLFLATVLALICLLFALAWSDTGGSRYRY